MLTAEQMPHWYSSPCPACDSAPGELCTSRRAGDLVDGKPRALPFPHHGRPLNPPHNVEDLAGVEGVDRV